MINKEIQYYKTKYNSLGKPILDGNVDSGLGKIVANEARTEACEVGTSNSDKSSSKSKLLVTAKSKIKKILTNNKTRYKIKHLQ